MPKSSFSLEKWASKPTNGALPVKLLKARLQQSVLVEGEGGEAFVGDPISKVRALNAYRPQRGDLDPECARPALAHLRPRAFIKPHAEHAVRRAGLLASQAEAAVHWPNRQSYLSQPLTEGELNELEVVRCSTLLERLGGGQSVLAAGWQRSAAGIPA